MGVVCERAESRASETRQEKRYGEGFCVFPFHFCEGFGFGRASEDSLGKEKKEKRKMFLRWGSGKEKAKKKESGEKVGREVSEKKSGESSPSTSLVSPCW